MVLSAFLATALALFWSRGFRAPVGQPANDGAGAPRSPKDEHNMDTTHGIICYVKRKSIECVLGPGFPSARHDVRLSTLLRYVAAHRMHLGV